MDFCRGVYGVRGVFLGDSQSTFSLAKLSRVRVAERNPENQLNPPFIPLRSRTPSARLRVVTNPPLLGVMLYPGTPHAKSTCPLPLAVC